MIDPMFWAGVGAGVAGTLGGIAVIAAIWNWNNARKARHLEEHAEHKATRAEQMKKLESYMRKPGISARSFYAALAEWERLNSQGAGSSALWRRGIYAKRVH